MKYKHWQKDVEDLVLKKKNSFNLSSIAKELGLKRVTYERDGKKFKTYKSISSVNYQLMRLVREGKLNKVGTYYFTPKRIGFTAFRSLISYARRFIRKFEKYGQELYKKTIEHTKKFYAAALKLISS